ncbi:MAG: hypothetical protein ABI538_12390 [Pseudoxanthomonas sp.]
MRPHATLKAIACILALSVPGVALCQKSEASLVGEFGTLGGTIYECPAGSALVGLTQSRTDRLMGISFTCVTLKKAMGAFWEDPEAAFLDPSGLKGAGTRPPSGVSGNTTCPYDYFLVGLSGELADYQEDPRNGWAQVDAPRMRIVDLQPVCRGPEGTLFFFPKGRLTAATPLRSQYDAHWNATKGCPAQYAAVGVHYSHRDSNDVAGFAGISLICDRVSHALRPGIDVVP